MNWNWFIVSLSLLSFEVCLIGVKAFQPSRFPKSWPQKSVFRRTVLVCATGDKQDLGFKAGINAMLVGNYLTTMGQPAQSDHEMLESLGLEGGEAPIPGEYTQA